jgi:hypothetical protein
VERIAEGGARDARAARGSRFVRSLKRALRPRPAAIASRG